MLENTQTFPAGHFKNKRALELGAGTGLDSIVLGLLGRRISVCSLLQP